MWPWWRSLRLVRLSTTSAPSNILLSYSLLLLYTSVRLSRSQISASMSEFVHYCIPKTCLVNEP